MGKNAPMELTKIQKIVADIRELPTKIDSAELAKNARRLLKKYALLSEKIERNVLTSVVHKKELANIRTEEFKAIRRKLKEKANLVLHANDNKNVPSAKTVKKTAKTPETKKTSKVAKEKVAASSKVVKESANKVKKQPKLDKATSSKKD